MKVIFLKDSTAKNGTLCLSGHKLILSGLGALIALPIILGLATYWVVSAIDRSLNPFVDPQYRIAVESRVNEQQQEMLKTRNYVRQHMDVLGRRVGSLQAQVSRINAVEMRIAESSGINLEDFQFYRNPRRIKNAWLISHIGKMIGALIASFTAFIIAGLSIDNLVAWTLPTILGTLYIIYWKRKVNPKTVASKEI